MQGVFAVAEELVVSVATVKQLVDLAPGNNSHEVILDRQPLHNNRPGHRAQANVDELITFSF